MEEYHKVVNISLSYLDHGKEGTILRLDLFKDKDKWENIYRKNTGAVLVVSHNDNRTIVPQIECENICPICNQKIEVPIYESATDNTEIAFDRHGHMLHSKCAETTYTTCEGCHNMIPIVSLAKNIYDGIDKEDEQGNYCADCYNRNCIID